MVLSLRGFFLISFIWILICGCSGNSTQPVSPENPVSSPGLTVREELGVSPDGANHYLMNYGYIFVDPNHPDSPQLEVIPVRQGEFHLNVLKLLEISPCTDCFRVVGFDFPEPGKLNLDILIEHPWADLDYSVFDVRAIIMFNGSHEFPICGKSTSDPALGDGVVLNPDGCTALYNGSTVTASCGEFKKYFQGELATWLVPDSDINGYKYFITDNPSNNRNAFYAGSVDVRTFSLQLPPITWVIGYAVDASWEPPISMPVDDPLTDFDLNANCTEPWKVVVTEEKIGPGLTIHGGLTRLLIDVYDWQGKSTHHEPVVECPEIFDGFLTGTWVSDEVDYTRYEVFVSNDNLAPVGNFLCLIGLEAIENDPTETPWLDLTAYQFSSLDVGEVGTDGNLIWAKRAGGTYFETGYAITTISDDSTVVTGSFTGSALFGQGEPNEIVLIHTGQGDIFIARYNPDGSLAWVKQAGGTDGDSGRGITSLSDNSTVVTGYFWISATFGQGEPNETVLNSGGYCDIFVARYNPDGSLAWAKQAGGIEHDKGYSIAALSDNSTVVTGYFYSSAIFGKGEPNETVLNSGGYCDIFVARYNPDGSLEWAKRAGGIYHNGGYGITALSDNSTVVTGSFTGSTTFGKGEPNETILNSAGNYDIFIARYNPDGSLAWVRQASTTFNGRGLSITTLSDNSTVVTGFFADSATFGPGEPNETVLISAKYQDVFIARYNPDGNLAWAKRAGGTSRDHGEGITTLSDNSTVVAGRFASSATFGQGEPNETILNSAGSTDIFIARYNPDGSLAWVNQASGTGQDEGWGITTLSDNSTVVTGNFGGFYGDSATFGLGEPNETILNSVGPYGDIFIARFAE